MPKELTDSDDLAWNVDGDVLTGARKTSAAVLKQWTEGEAYELTSVTRDADGVVETGVVKWPDGSAGVFTTTAKNATWLGIDAFTVTHAASSQTVTQAAITRDANGAVDTKPALAVA